MFGVTPDVSKIIHKVVIELRTAADYHEDRALEKTTQGFKLKGEAEEHGDKAVRANMLAIKIEELLEV